MLDKPPSPLNYPPRFGTLGIRRFLWNVYD